MKKARKIALVTGSSRGIGKAIAKRLASDGFTLVLSATKKSPAATETLKEVRSVNSHSKLYYCKVENQDAVKNWAKKIKKDFGLIDVLVNNAGIVMDRTFEKMSFEEWDRVIKVNLYGTYFVTKSVLPLINAGGRIINIGSIVGLQGSFGQSNYAAAKAAIISLTKSLALELAKKKITVNAVCPGYIETDMLKSVPPEILKDRILPKIPLKRTGTTEEVASSVAYLASDESAYLTGQTIAVSGGI